MSEVQSVPAAFTAAVRTLLDTPLLTEGMEGFRETYAWRLELRAFFARVAALTVQSGPGVLRLVLSPPFPEGGRAWADVRSPQAAGFVAWVLWYHEFLGVQAGEVRQFSLAELASAISSHPQAQDLDFSVRSQRLALLQAVRALRELGALAIVDESSQEWESGESDAGSSGGALLEFTAAAPYLISRPSELPASAAQRAIRMLLCGPSMTCAQDPEAFEQLNAPLLEDLQHTLGWRLSVNGEYATLHREGLVRGMGSRWMPGRSAASSVALLLLSAVCKEVQHQRLTPEDSGRLTVTKVRLYGLLDQVRATHRARWGTMGKESTEKLLELVLAEWRLWGGVAVSDTASVTLEPHLARFDSTYETEATGEARGQSEKQAITSLFD